jgi:hypothetical protein
VRDAKTYYFSAAGKAALKGIDINGNVVRDDIEIKIHEYVPKPDQ